MSIVAELPTEKDAERIVLGSILLGKKIPPEVEALLTPEDFADEANRKIFRYCLRLKQAGKPIEPVLIRDKLGESGLMGHANPAAYVAELGKIASTVAHAEHYAEIVAESSYKRRIYKITSEAAAHALNGRASAEILSDLQADIADLRRDGIGRCERHALAELREKFPTLNPPVVEGVFREGETCNIIAAPKVGKSWLGYGLALSIITGRPWLDRFETSKGKVLLIDNELHPSTLAHRIPEVAKGMSLFPDDYEHDLEIWSLRGKLKSLEELKPDFLELEPDRYKLIIFDAKYRFANAGASENDNSNETQFYNLVDWIGEHTKAANVLIHHATKGNQSAKGVTDVGAGAGSQARAADCHMVIRPHEEEGVVVLDAAVRSFAPMQPLALRWDFPCWVPDICADPEQLAGLKTKSAERQQADDKEGCDQIIKGLLDGRATASTLGGKVGIGRERLKRLLGKLVSDDQIVAEEVTIRNNKCLEYSLPEPED